MRISSGPMGLLLAAVLAMVASDVRAQRGGPDGGRPGRGGFRGGPPRGGMMGRGGPGGPGLLGLLQSQEVREELELLPDQQEALQKIAANRPRPERPEGINFRDRSEENREKLEAFMEKVRQQREEFEKKARLQLEEVLFPEQLERLQQIEVQAMGMRALFMDRVAEELQLSEQQRKQLRETSREATEEMFSKMREMFRSGDREGMREKMQQARQETEEKVLGVLTSEQKQKFEAMKGEPFKMPDRRGGFRGRGGRGGGDGGARGGGRRGGGGDGRGRGGRGRGGRGDQ